MRNTNIVKKEIEAYNTFMELHQPHYKVEYTYERLAQKFGVSTRTAKRYVANGKNTF